MGYHDVFQIKDGAAFLNADDVHYSIDRHSFDALLGTGRNGDDSFPGELVPVFPVLDERHVAIGDSYKIVNGFSLLFAYSFNCAVQEEFNKKTDSIRGITYEPSVHSEEHAPASSAAPEKSGDDAENKKN